MTNDTKVPTDRRSQAPALYDYRTGEYIRTATAEEVAES